MSHLVRISLSSYAVFLFIPLVASTTAAPSASVGSSPALEKIIKDYCVAASDAAAETRAARQALALKDLRVRVEERIAALQQVKIELEALVARQEALRTLADQELVSIYSGMAPDIAATQIERIGSSLASSVLRQLKPRTASAILNEMKPEIAAELVKTIAIAPQEYGDSK